MHTVRARHPSPIVAVSAQLSLLSNPSPAVNGRFLSPALQLLNPCPCHSVPPAPRYARFLALHAVHPRQLLVPTADIALLWHTHMGLSWSYTDTWAELASLAVQHGLGRGAEGTEVGEQQPGGVGFNGAGVTLPRPDYLALSSRKREEAFATTALLYAETFGA